MRYKNLFEKGTWNTDSVFINSASSVERSCNTSFTYNLSSLPESLASSIYAYRSVVSFFYVTYLATVNINDYNRIKG